MAKKPWGAGAWAAESELAEAQQQLEHEQHQQQQSSSLFAGDAAFPSLGEAAHTKIPKKKKQTVPLAKFIAGGTPVFSEGKGLTIEEKRGLPTGPRDRSGEEESPGGLGGGFRDYGGYRGEGRDRDYGRDRDGGRRSDREGGFGRGGFTGDRDALDEPSRADIVDDWGASKKFALPSRGRYEDDGKRGGRFDDRDFPSRADDDNHWGSSKRFVPAPPSNGVGRRVSKYDFSSSRGGGPLDSSSKADDADSWGAAKKAGPAGGYDSLGHRDRDFWNSREKHAIDTDSWTRKDAGRLTGRPRLVLQPRSQCSDTSPSPAPKEDTENEPPPADYISEPGSKHQKVNPFGEAKPREVVLEEKGLNWKELDAELEQKTKDRSDGGELTLREEIKALQESLKLAEAETNEEGTEGLDELKEQLNKKEQELQQLKASSRSDKSNRGFWGPSERKDSDVWSRPPSNGNLSTSEKRGRW